MITLHLFSELQYNYFRIRINKKNFKQFFLTIHKDELFEISEPYNGIPKWNA